jgi:DNA topoisomerase-1
VDSSQRENRAGVVATREENILKPLMIVESPTKAKTLTRILGEKYRIEASVGHIRDLPKSDDAVDVENGFRTRYVVNESKQATVKKLKAAAAEASEILLATDPDREGEAIGWHILQVLKPKVPVRRIVFHALTKKDVEHGIAEARAVDEQLVDAQEARRILDRLYGFQVSPVLWNRMSPKMSAGRVQSIAVRLLAEREEERKAFRTAGYWDLEATISGQGREFTAKLVRVGDRRVAIGKDFDGVTGTLKGGNVLVLDGPASGALAATIGDALPWTVTSVESKPGVQRPSPPFTTSSMQQEANRKFGFSSRRTMDAAQRLFQEGLISYHRTDSVVLSADALREAGVAIRNLYGDGFYDGPRRYAAKVKNAQEAHEAIRPTDFARTAEKLGSGVRPDDARLYDLIWKRAVASQMVDAKVVKTAVEITATGSDRVPCVLSASGKVVQFPGFLRAYVEGSDDPEAALEDRDVLLPDCKVGDRVSRAGTPGAALELVSLEPKAHKTEPPARYTEASLIKRMEAEGVGRPSTYASILETVIDKREYAYRSGKALVAAFTAMVLTVFLKEHFARLVELGFTSEVEESLDEISNGRMSRVDFLTRFFFGDADWEGLKALVGRFHGKEYPFYTVGTSPSTGEPLIVKVGKFGAYLQRGEGGKGNTGSIPSGTAPADFTPEAADELIGGSASGAGGDGARTVGTDPASGLAVRILKGPYGHYAQLGETPDKKDKKAAKPRRASIPKEEDPQAVTLARCLELLSLPRELGTHPDGGAVLANAGRFGPYVMHGKEFRSIKAPASVYTITLAEALELLAKPKAPSRRRTFTKKK